MLSLYDCQRIAEDNGYDSLKFKIHINSKIIECKWLDAYFGMFQIIGKEGFFTVNDMLQLYPEIKCEIIDES